MKKDQRCLTCSELDKCRDSHASWIFFIIGLIATISIRVVTVLIEINPLYGKAAWYTGVGGFFIFFVYKFRVNRARAELIKKNKLADKVNTKSALTDQDYRLISGILCSLSSKKETINYFFIFGLSAVALALAIYFDFIK